MTEVDVYARISDDREGLRKGVDRQLPDCRAYAEKHRLTVAAEYVDNDITASRKHGRTKPRPGYLELYDRIKGGATKTIVVWHLDRLYRNVRELEDLIDLVESTQVRIRTVTGGDFDLNTSDGRAMARVVVAFNMKESEDKSRRVLAKHRELAEEGRRSGGGTRQFGYTYDHDELVADEAELVRHAAGRVLDGESVRAVCADWNARGILTVTGKKWTQHVLRRLLTAASTAGLREHKGVVRPGTWPAILDHATHQRLRAKLLDPARRTNTTARRYLLAGFLRCGRCDARMVARPRADKRRAYVCASGPGFGGCGKMGVLAEPLEAEVAGILFAWVDVPAVERAVERAREDGDDQALLDAIQRDEAELEQWAVDAVEQRVTRGQMLAATQRLNARVEATRRQLVRRHDDRTAAAWDGQGGALRAAWPGWSLDKKRALLATYIEHITIGPAIRGLNRFDRDRLLPERGGGIGWRR